MAFIISSLIVLAVWLFGMLQLHRIFSFTALANDGNGSCIDSVHYDNATLLGITESFISCRKVFERTPQYQSFDSFRTGVSSLTGQQKESIKRSLYICFSPFRPYISCFNGRLNETEQFCFICSLLHLDNKHCSQLLDISESSVRSCRTRLKDKLQPVTLQLLYDDIQ